MTGERWSVGMLPIYDGGRPGRPRGRSGGAGRANRRFVLPDQRPTSAPTGCRITGILVDSLAVPTRRVAWSWPRSRARPTVRSKDNPAGVSRFVGDDLGD